MLNCSQNQSREFNRHEPRPRYRLPLSLTVTPHDTPLCLRGRGPAGRAGRRAEAPPRRFACTEETGDGDGAFEGRDHWGQWPWAVAGL